jgi:hypothetical protein
MKHHACGWLFALALGLGVASAPAQPRPAPSPSASAAPAAAPPAQEGGDPARKLFEEGTEALNDGKFADAADKLRAAWRLRESYDIAANLGAALHKLERHAEAATFLSFALREYPVGAKQSVKKWLEELLAEAKKEVVTVRVQVSADGADVIVNGEPCGKSPVTRELYAAPGAITVEATKEGFERAQAKQDGAKGGSVQMSLTLVPRKTKEVPPVPPRSMVPAYVLGGVAVVALGVGIGSAVAAGEKAGAADRQLQAIRETRGPCTSPPEDNACKDLLVMREEQRTLQNLVLWSFLGAGAAAIGTSVYVFVTRSTAPPKVALAPAVLPNGSGFVMMGKW